MERQNFWQLWWSLPEGPHRFLELLRTERVQAISPYLLDKMDLPRGPLLTAWLEVLSPDVVVDYADRETLASDVAWVLDSLANFWPPDLDPAPILDILGQIQPTHPFYQRLLFAAAQTGAPAAPWVEKVFENFLRTGSLEVGRFYGLERLYQCLAPEVREGYLAQAAVSRHPKVQSWRLECLTEHPDSVAELSVYLESFLEDPKLGFTVAQRYRCWLVGALRARLVGSGLPPSLGYCVLLAIEDYPQFKERFPTAPELSPLTEDELEALRGLRDASLGTPALRWYLIAWPRPLAKQDWAFLERFIEEPELLSANIGSLERGLADLFEGGLDDHARSYLVRIRALFPPSRRIFIDGLLSRKKRR